MDLITICISFAAFLAYVIYAVVKMQDSPYKIPHSISQTHYYVPWANGMSTAYMAMCLLALGPILAMNAWFWWAKAFGVLALACLIGVAGAPNYWDEKELGPHCWLTYTCEGAIVPFIVLATNFWWVALVYAVVFLLPCFLTKTWKDCRSFWLELIAFFSFYTSVILQLIFF